RGNQVQKISNLENLQTLQTLDLSSNKIQSLCGLENHKLLETIDLEDNQEQPDYRLSVLFILQRLTVLDLQPVKAEEKGKFIQTMKYGGHYYGLTRDAIEVVAGEGLACCVHMELEGVRSLKNTCFEPRYILLIPMDKEEYARRLRMRGLYSKSQIEMAVSRVDTYIKMNRDFPGFFDTVIPCDDLQDAYIKLNQLVREYLGLGEQERFENAGATAGDETYTDSARESPVTDRDRSSPSGVNVSKLAQSTGAKDLFDSANRNYSARIQAALLAPKSPVEQASIQRRQQAAREALQGKSPSAYTRLFKRGPLTAPASLGPRQHLLDPASYSSMLPSGSNVTHDRSFSPGRPDSSSVESHASSGMSMLSSAGAFSSATSSGANTPTNGLVIGAEPAVEPLDISGLGHELDSLKEGYIENLNLGESYTFYMIHSLRPGSEYSITINPIFVDIEGPVTTGNIKTYFSGKDQPRQLALNSSTSVYQLKNLAHDTEYVLSLYVLFGSIVGPGITATIRTYGISFFNQIFCFQHHLAVSQTFTRTSIDVAWSSIVGATEYKISWSPVTGKYKNILYMWFSLIMFTPIKAVTFLVTVSTVTSYSSFSRN
ncbi:UNVERIFIED_CONTAM: hypothetical protein FKN15_023706, partial [Acipenser sinensis]